MAIASRQRHLLLSYGTIYPREQHFWPVSRKGHARQPDSLPTDFRQLPTRHGERPRGSNRSFGKSATVTTPRHAAVNPVHEPRDGSMRADLSARRPRLTFNLARRCQRADATTVDAHGRHPVQKFCKSAAGRGRHLVAVREDVGSDYMTTRCDQPKSKDPSPMPSSGAALRRGVPAVIGGTEHQAMPTVVVDHVQTEAARPFDTARPNRAY